MEEPEPLVPLVPPKRWSLSPRRRVQLAFVVVIVWALVASATLGWYVERNSAQAWNADSIFLLRLGEELSYAAIDLNTALKWENTTWGETAAGYIYVGSRLVQDESTPDAASLVASLNLTQRNLYCASMGLTSTMAGIHVNDSSWTGPLGKGPYLTNLTAVLEYLSTELGSVTLSGTNPISQLGPTTVSEIRNQGGQLLVLTVASSQSIYCP